MDYNKLLELTDEMSKIKGYRLKTDYLLKLINSHVKSNQEDKFDFENKINEFIFNTFLDSIDSKSKEKLYNINVNINEERHSLSKKYPLWHIDNYGAYKFKIDDENISIEETIPRDHDIGFYLTDDASEEAISFMKKNGLRLGIINDYMTEKENIINYDYKPKNNVPREFTENLIDYIGFRRIEDVNSNNMNKKR